MLAPRPVYVCGSRVASCSSAPCRGGSSGSISAEGTSEVFSALHSGAGTDAGAGAGASSSYIMAMEVQRPKTATPVTWPSNPLPAHAHTPAASANTPDPSLLFNGLRVRMGMSSGVLPAGTKALGSDILNRAKEVSDAGAGGQVGTGVGGGGRLDGSASWDRHTCVHAPTHPIHACTGHTCAHASTSASHAIGRTCVHVSNVVFSCTHLRFP